MKEERWDAIVVGAGVAGLAAVWTLRRRGHRVLGLEAADRLGGVIRTETREGWLFELGPNTVLSRPPLPRFLEELGLGEEAYRVPVADRDRFVWHRGRLHRVPRNPLQMAGSRLFSLRAKIALAAEPWNRSRSEGEETIADFVRRRLSSEWLDTLVGPFVSGIYAGDPERLAARSTLGPLVSLETKHGSLIRGFRASRSRQGSGRGLPKRTMISFPGGLERLVERLGAEAGEIRTSTAVESVVREPDGEFRVRAAGTAARAPRLVLAVPAGPAAGLLSGMTGGESLLLRSLDYAPLVVAGFGFRADSLTRAPTGTGFLVPRGGNVRILGCLCSSNLFPERAPGDGVNLTVFLGGALDPEPLDWSDDEILRQASSDLDRVFGVERAPEVALCRRFPQAIPQYDVGHRARLAAVDRWERDIPGLALAGSYLRGVALPDAMESGCRAAERVDELVDRPREPLVLLDSASS